MKTKLSALLMLVLLTLLSGCFFKNDDKKDGIKEIQIVGLEDGKIQVSKTSQLTVQKIYENNEIEYGAESWQSSTAGVITVNSNGLITAISEGTAIITATAEGKTVSKEVTVIAYNRILGLINYQPFNGDSVFVDESIKNDVINYEYKRTVGKHEELPVEVKEVIEINMSSGKSQKAFLTWKKYTTTLGGIAYEAEILQENTDRIVLTCNVNTYDIQSAGTIKVEKIEGYLDSYEKPETIMVTLNDENKTQRTAEITSWDKYSTVSNVNYYKGTLKGSSFKVDLKETNYEMEKITGIDGTGILEITSTEGSIYVVPENTYTFEEKVKGVALTNGAIITQIYVSIDGAVTTSTALNLVWKDTTGKEVSSVTMSSVKASFEASIEGVNKKYRLNLLPLVIYNIETQNIYYDSSAKTYEKPKKVDVTMTDGSTKTVDVEYTVTTAGGVSTKVQEIYCNGLIYEAIGKVEGYSKNVKLIVQPLEILGLDTSSSIVSIEKDATYSLPTTEKLKRNDGTTIDANVTWYSDLAMTNAVSSINTGIVNTITLYGDVANTTETYTLTINVVASELVATSGSISVKVGSEYTLPTTVKVKNYTNAEVDANVTWYSDSAMTSAVSSISTSTVASITVYGSVKSTLNGVYTLTINVVESGEIRVHYQRADNTYTGWGLHLWGDGIPTNTSGDFVIGDNSYNWGSPLMFSNTDDFGTYATIEYISKSDINFIVHNGNTKDQADDSANGLIPSSLLNLTDIYIVAGSYDANGRLAILTSKPEKPAGEYIKFHYHRAAGDETSYGLHTWGDGLVNAVWADGPIVYFNQKDSFGYYAEVEITNKAQTFNFLIRDAAGTKDGADRTNAGAGYAVTDASGNIKEYWLVEGENDVYDSEPSFDTKAKTATIKKSTSTNYYVDATLTAEDLLLSMVKLKDSIGEEITPTYVEKDGLNLKVGLPSYDISKNYYIIINSIETVAELDVDLATASDYTYTGDDLGATLNDDGTATLKLWSPTATNVKVHVYDKNNQKVKLLDSTKKEEIVMTRGDKGVWSVILDSSNTGVSNLDGYFYQYEVTAYGKTMRALDPYAKSMAAFGASADSSDGIGKAAIININSSKAGTKPSFMGNTRLANENQMVAYEAHVRDFTIDPTEAVANAGTFKGFAEWTKGIEHLKDLGITHVQLMPIQNFYTVDEKTKSYSDGNSWNINYNWGYDPHNYFTPEGWYSTNPEDPYARIKEFRELVSSLHENGIGVIMDVVYNHTYSNDIFNNVAPGLYYRPEGGTYPVGAPAVASERPMVRKLIVDSMKYYVDEFGVDGFRFDLMGFIDNETIKQAREELGSQVILQGEAWNYTDMADGLSPVKAETDVTEHGISDLAYFNDTSRDAYKGGMGDAQVEMVGFIQGGYHMNAKAKSGITAGIKGFDNGGNYADISTDDYDIFAVNPNETLQFLSIHDGFTLWDKMNLTIDGTEEERAKSVKQAIAMLMTSQGKVIFHAGMEIGRTKPLAKYDAETGRAHTTDLANKDSDIGVTTFHENTYKSSDYTNEIRWSRKDKDVFKGLYNYTKGLINMRKAIPALRYESADSIKSGLRFIGETKPDTEEVEKAGYTTFNEVETFTINFVNAAESARNKTWYFAGEATPGATSGNNGNDADLAMPTITIDSEGKASITFTKEDIAKFQLSIWGATSDLNFKLVAVPGDWTAPDGAYSVSGNTRVIAANIEKGNNITVDLSVVDHQAGTSMTTGEKFIAYTLNNTLETDGGTSPFTKLLVVHNADTKPVVIENSNITTSWRVIMDEDDAGLTELSYTSTPLASGQTAVKIETGRVIVPANSSAVIAQ